MTQIMNIFPVPIYFENCNFDYTEEFEFLKREPGVDEINWKKQKSADTFLLRKPELKRLKDWIEITLDTFIKNLYQSQTELYITQAWLNTIEPGGYHPDHYHPNSIISGVWYPEIAVGQTSFIHFCNFQRPNIIELSTYNPTPYNSTTWEPIIESGQLILFPSNTFHGVRQNITDTNRYSLSFNTWTHSDLGDKSHLTYCSTK
tara:strand:+ start:422 stop:1030 length:609 start_codon:yes stop_codon:yes gene_type:complete